MFTVNAAVILSMPAAPPFAAPYLVHEPVSEFIRNLGEHERDRWGIRERPAPPSGG